MPFENIRSLCSATTLERVGGFASPTCNFDVLALPAIQKGKHSVRRMSTEADKSMRMHQSSETRQCLLLEFRKLGFNLFSSVIDRSIDMTGQ